MAMAVYTFLNNQNTAIQRVEFAQISPGLYCRTLFSA